MFASIPFPIFAALYCVLFGLVGELSAISFCVSIIALSHNCVFLSFESMVLFSPASVGLSFLQFTNMNSMRNLIITGLSLFLGISVPRFFDDYYNLETGRGLVRSNAGWVYYRSYPLLSSDPSYSIRNFAHL